MTTTTTTTTTMLPILSKLMNTITLYNNDYTTKETIYRTILHDTGVKDTFNSVYDLNKELRRLDQTSAFGLDCGFVSIILNEDTFPGVRKACLAIEQAIRHDSATLEQKVFHAMFWVTVTSKSVELSPNGTLGVQSVTIKKYELKELFKGMGITLSTRLD